MDVGAAVAIGLALAVGATLCVAGVRRRSLVRSASAAVQTLAVLNAEWKPRLKAPAPIHLKFRDAVDSKGRFDRYDLQAFFHQQLASNANQVQARVDEHERVHALHREYQQAVDRVVALVGSSSHPKVHPRKFASIEKRMFKWATLSDRTRMGRLSCSVSYTTPQRKNHYSKAATYNYDDIRRGLEHVREVAAQRSTTTFLRKQERNRMSSALRAQVLNRDGGRCKMCGVSAGHGAILHVDHVIPVSRGGRTDLDNLQALCQECNLGKGNRF